MKHYFVRFYVMCPPTLSLAAWEAERGTTITYEHTIEYGSDILKIEKAIADQWYHLRGNGNPDYFFQNSPLPVVCLLDWRELLGDQRPNDVLDIVE